MEKVITLRYRGKCRKCSDRLPKGSRALWCGKGTVYCEDCAGLEPDNYSTWMSKEETPTSDGFRSWVTKNNPGLIIMSSGEEVSQNPEGRCIDAPCCGCCS